MSKDENENFLDMGDDDFVKINPSTKDEPIQEEVIPVIDNNSEENKEEVTTEVIPETETEEKVKEPDPKVDEWKEYEEDTSKTDEENTDAKALHDKTKPAEKTPEVTNKDDEKNPDGTPKDKQAPKSVDETKPIDYQAFYSEIMKPFKANGREIKLNSPEEAIRLMQMGAGYGRKLQDLQPHLKTIRMLEKNSLLDEGKLSYLIDLSLRKPDAIKKLIKDSGIDPLDLNMDDAVTYCPTNHSVTDEEVSFDSALKDLKSSPGGLETIREINTKWDPVSKKAIYESPQILEVIQSQRENGIYDQINSEIDRQKLLGHIKPNTPFLESYKIAGDYLQTNNLFQITTATVQPDKPTPVILATRAAPVKSEVKNSEKAQAAAPTQATSRKASETKNPLDMADDDFLKQFHGRL